MNHNTCRLCGKTIPARLCFCTGCTRDRLTADERLALMGVQTPAAREQMAQAVVDRINRVGRSKRPSTPPAQTGAARAAFQETRRILAPLIGKTR